MIPMRSLLAATASLALALPLAGQSTLEFDPKVGAIGAEVVVKSPVPPGAVLRFAGRTLPLLREPNRPPSFVIPLSSATGFLELVVDGKLVAKSAVPFIVSGTSLVSAPKLVGLKEAIDVFGYVDPRPEGALAPEPKAKAVLKLGDNDILTIGEAPPSRLGTAVELGDASSAARTGMGQPGFLITARPPKKKLTVPTPPPN